MLNRIIEFSIRNKLIIGLFVIALIIYGSYQVTRLPIDAVPDITNNQVQVITVAPSYGATDIERLVTFPIEQANSNISGLEEIRSFSRFGLSVVTIVFEDNIDVYWARQQVAERLQNVRNEIPSDIGTPELGPITTGLGEIYQYVVRPAKGYEDRYTETELRTIQDWIIRRQLLGVKGVAEVSSFGGKLKQFEIAIDPARLQSHNLSINDVFSSLEKNNQNTGGAYIEKGPTVLFIRSEGLIGSEEDIRNISIRSTEAGTPILIRDIADVTIGHATRYGALCFNDQGEVAGAIVMMLKDANSSQVISNVKDRIEGIKKTLPEGIIIEPFLDRTKMVNNAISTVETNLLEGALIVIFILVLFLGNIRAGLLVASVIPLSMLFAVILMNTFKVSGNLMSLGALDFGLIVDGAVIIVEAVMHQLFHSKKFRQVSTLSQAQMDLEVKHSASKMMNSAVFGQLIILIVYLPIFTLRGIEGKMFMPMAQTVSFALIGAFILSLTYVPMMSALVLSKKLKHEPTLSDRMMLKLEAIYSSALSRALRYPKTIILSIVALLTLALITLTSLGGEFIPELEEGDFAVETRVLTGSNLTTTVETTQKAVKILLERFPEVEKVVTKIGSGEVPTDPMPMEASDMMIILKDKSEWTTAETFDELAAKMSEAVSEVPGMTTSFQYPVQMRFNELMTGARQDVVCKIFGENLDTLLRLANRLGSIASKVEGTEELFIEPVAGMPQIVINYNRDKLAQFDLNISDVNKVVNSSLAGQSAGLVYEGEKRFDLVVKVRAEQRNEVEDIRNLLIPSDNGNQVPLNQIADVNIINGPNQIQREDAKRRIVVGFNVGDRDVQSIVDELKTITEQQLKFPPGYYITYGGAFENLNAAKDRLMIAVPVSLLLIFILLYFAFHSLKLSLLIYTAIPLSAIGGIFFLFLRGMPFSISAGIGFIALFGVAVLNGIVLIAEFNRHKLAGLKNSCLIVMRSSLSRLRPVLMTALVASLGFLPMALSKGSGAEVQRPLATVVIGGLIIATFLTLFVLPVLYILFEKTKFNTRSGILGILPMLLLLIPNTSAAQSTITISAAIDSALKNNYEVKSSALIAAREKKMIMASSSMQQATINGEFGQINSSYNDNLVGIQQSISFPTVHINESKLQRERWKVAALETSLKEADIKKRTRSIFYEILILHEKEKLLLKADSNYLEFRKKVQLRFDKGESNILEKATADHQQAMIHAQLRTLQNDLELARLNFQLILGLKNYQKPVAENVKLDLPLPDSSTIQEHPILKVAEQQKKEAELATRLERSKLLPNLSLGFNSMTQQGTGSDEVFYNSSTRFNSINAGIGIPLLPWSQRARISASKINQELASHEAESQKQELQKKFQSARTTLLLNSESLSYYEQSGLKNSNLTSEAANQKFMNGEINYLEWVLLMNQSIEIKSRYFDAVNAYNESIISIYYITSK